jgi:hypothetical protein
MDQVLGTFALVMSLMIAVKMFHLLHTAIDISAGNLAIFPNPLNS